MAMKNPPHPGEIIRKDCIEPIGLTIKRAAEGLGVSRKHLSSIVNGHTGISPKMAIRLSEAFGGSPYTWLIQQAQYDLRKAGQEGEPDVERFASV